jgi:signal transduction histidine kinase
MRTETIRRWHVRHPKITSALLVGVVAAIQVVLSVLAHRGQPERVQPDGLAYLLLVLGPILLWWRHRYPALVVIGAAKVTLIYMLIGYPYGPIIASPIIAAFYAIAGGRRTAAWGSAIGLLVLHFAGSRLLHTPGGPAFFPTAMLTAGWMAAILGLAELLQLRTKWVSENQRARQAEADTKVSEERLRIARELHDVVAHNISLINVQAGVALHLIDDQPEQARTALTAIKQASKEALVELRSVLGVLRQVDEPEPTQPAPSLQGLDQLVERTRQANLDVRVERVGEPRTLPPGVDVAAYRIVQEALTNVVRHASARVARVKVEYGKDHLTVAVDDDGRGVANAAKRNGSGLVGMRERAEALGGKLVTGRSEPGGFSVKATLPMEVAE